MNAAKGFVRGQRTPGSLSRSHFVLSLMLIDDNLSHNVAGQWNGASPCSHCTGWPNGIGTVVPTRAKSAVPILSACPSRIVASAGKKRMDI